jgi:hypothetical protein
MFTQGMSPNEHVPAAFPSSVALMKARGAGPAELQLAEERATPAAMHPSAHVRFANRTQRAEPIFEPIMETG